MSVINSDINKSVYVNKDSVFCHTNTSLLAFNSKFKSNVCLVLLHSLHRCSLWVQTGPYSLHLISQSVGRSISNVTGIYAPAVRLGVHRGNRELTPTPQAPAGNQLLLQNVQLLPCSTVCFTVWRLAVWVIELQYPICTVIWHSCRLPYWLFQIDR